VRVQSVEYSIEGSTLVRVQSVEYSIEGFGF